MIKGVNKLQVMEDSKLVIDWARQKESLTDVRIGPLLKVIKSAFQSFKWISFCHILGELNVKVDELSKEALSLPVGVLGVYEFIEGEEVESMKFQF